MSSTVSPPSDAAPLYRLLYVSSASHRMSAQELAELLQQSRRNNERLGITGMLLYKDGDFMQVIEGEEPAVRALYARIERDPRHGGSTVLLEEPAQTRLFGEWAMGFREARDAELRQLPGFSDFMNHPLAAAALGRLDDPSGCLELLLLFRQMR